MPTAKDIDERATMEGNLNLGETRKQTESQVKGFVDEIRQKIQDKVSYFVHTMEMMHKFTIKNIVKLRVLPLTFLTSRHLDILLFLFKLDLDASFKAKYSFEFSAQERGIKG